MTIIGANAFAECPNVTIWCNEGTTGYNYAKENGVKYEILNPDATPETVDVNGITYYIQNGSAIAIDCEDTLTEVVIPSTVNGAPVIELRGTFQNHKNIVTVTLPEGLKIINDNTFNCPSSNLTSVNIPSTVTTIGNNTFSLCSKLTEISLPEGLTKIGDYAFSGCSGVTEIVLPDSLTGVGIDAFSGCHGLTEIIIPDSFTSINYSAFESCNGLTSVVIPDSVSSIHHGAFNNCSNLKYVIVPESVTLIENYSFDELTILAVYEGSYAHSFSVENNLFHIIYDGIHTPEVYTENGISYYITNGEAIAYNSDDTLTSAVIPATVSGYPVTEIISAFMDNNNIKFVTLPEGLKVIGNSAFAGASCLSSVNIPSTVTSIEYNAFYECCTLTEIILPDGLKSIGEAAFSFCTGLTKIILPDGIENIGSGAFVGCSGLTGINLPDSITSIETIAFFGCDRFTEIVLPDSITSIGSGAFMMCSNLAAVTIPEGVTGIAENAFGSCPKLITVVIPKSVTSLYTSSFSETTVLAVYKDSYAHTFAVDNGLLYGIYDGVNPLEIYIDGGVTYYTADGEAVVIGVDDNLTEIVIPAKINGYPITEIGNNAFCESNVTEIVLPDGIKRIGENAFRYCSSLTTINLPDSISEIGSGAFYECKELVEIVIPKGVTVLEANLFFSCDNLSSVTIPEGVTRINKYAFKYCSKLVMVIIPNSVISIDIDSFSYSYNDPNHSIIFALYENSYAHTFAIDNGINYVFYDGINLTEPYVNKDGIQYSIISRNAVAVKADENLTEAVIPETVNGYPVTGIESAFKRHTGIVSVTLPEGLKTIGTSAFEDASNLKKVNIPSTVTSIGDYAFADCSSLTEITLPEGLTSIGIQSFANCTGLTEIVFPDGFTSIGDVAFLSCAGLAKVKFSDSITKIGSGAFFSCTGLTEIDLPERLTIIDVIAFWGCSGLTEIVIPEGVTSIGMAAFNYCSNLSRIILPDTLVSIDSSAFYDCPDLRMIVIPESVNNISKDSFNASTILIDHESSYAHTFAVENDLLYFVLRETANPEIAYGTGITGTVSYSDGTVAAGATVEIYYSDGTLKESVTADESGAYAFTYAEVGRYTVRASDESRNVSSTKVSVKRMNVFSVFLAGDTAITLKKGYSVSGTVSASPAKITLTDTDGHIIAETTSDNGSFTFDNIPNGTYIIKAETENGSASQEITVFDGDLTDIVLEIIPATSTVFGYVEIEKRDGTTDPRNWVNVSIYNGEGTLIDTVKSDDNGRYSFENLILGEYSIVAVAEEMRPDKEYGYNRIHTFTGYGYIYIATPGTYELDVIVLHEDSEAVGTVSGKVTANGETQDCIVVLCDSFKKEIARYVTKKNGKYTFVNVCDGYYYITATTKSNGMGWTTVVVKDGEIYGDTDIRVAKSDTVKSREDRFLYDVPELSTVSDIESYRNRIAEEKRFYDGLSEKEKKQLSEDYITRLNQYAEVLAGCKYISDDGITVEQGGLVVSGDEIANKDSVSFEINVNRTEAPEENTTGVEDAEDFIQNSINDAAGECEIVQYYEITMTKANGSDEKPITSVYKDTDAMGKFRITLPIPEEYRGYKNYSVIHNHCGEIVTLTDLDDDPNTITIEIDEFSTFVLAATDNELVLEEDDITVSEDFKIKSAKLVLTEDISVIYKATIPEGYTDHYMVFNYHGEDTIVYGTVNEDGTYSFAFDGVLPQCMGDNIKATLYATVDGKTVSVSVDEYSVRKYCENQLAKTSDTKFITLMSDLLTLGAASQEYISYNCDSLVTDGLALTPSTFTELDESANKEKISGTKDEGLEWRSGGLIYNNAMAMFVRFSATDTEDLQVQLTIEDRVLTYDVSELEQNSNGHYTVILSDIIATEYDSTVTGIFLRNGVQTGETLTYSVNSYVYTAQNSNDAALAKIVRATYNYGRSAIEYVEQ